MPPVLAADLQPKLYLSLVCVLGTVPCALIGWRDRAGPGRLLGLASLCFAVGLPSLLFKAFLPRVPVTILGNALVLAALGLHWHFAARFAGRARPGWTAAVMPAAWAACWLWPRFTATLDLRIMVAALMTGTLSLLAVRDMLRVRTRSLSARMLAAASASQVLMSLGRAWLAAGGAAFGRSPAWIICTELDILGYILLWPTLGLAMIHRQLIDQERDRGQLDELSGVLNRRGFLLKAPGHRGATTLLFDIDRFKRINDEYGHGCGDGAIVAFVDLTRSLLPEGAVFARIGGEEFAMLLVERQHGQAERVAEAVRLAFAALVLPGGIRATVSVGIARPDPHGRNGVGDGLERADRALYEAKRTGRNRTCTWSGVPEAAAGEGDGPAGNVRALQMV